MINSKTATLIKALETFPEQWALTPVHNKAPKIKNWQHGIDRKTIIEELETGRANGIGLITGELSGCILAIDCDGPTAHQLAEKLGGLPHTVSWTSGKPGRAQYLYLVPSEYRELLKNFTRKVLETGTKGEQLEIRYNASQSVLPPSQHPETDGYKSINSIENTPIAEVPTWVIEKILDEKPEQPKLDFTQAQNFDPIPLIKCLSREHREWVANGINHGGRNDAGAELARDLIGTESQLQYLGIPYNDSARGLFDDYCDRCNPPINNGERETIWRSAQKDNPTPCLDDDKLENCYKHWQRKQRQPSTNNSKTNYQTSGNTALKPDTQSNVVPINKYQQQPINIDLIEEELREIAEQNLPKSKEQLKLNELARKANIQPRDLQETYKNFKEEREEKEAQSDLKIEVDELLKNRNQTLDLTQYLPGYLSQITELSTRLGLRPEVGLSAFLSVVSSLQNVNNEINLIGYTKFRQPLGLFNAICAEPSQKKSPLINMIATEPLREMQREARKQYEQELAAYDALPDDQKPLEKPVERAYFAHSMSQAGMRNLLNAQSKNGWGILILCDELAGNFKNNKKSYNDGMTEDLLSAYDSFGKREYLKDGWASDYDRCLVSILGGIQPGVMREFNDGSDGNGKWARFNYLNQPLSPYIIPVPTPAEIDVKPMLTDFYRKIAALPQLNLRLSPEAEKGFITINNKCEMYRVNAKTQALAAQWGKAPGKIGRFAALIHIIHEVAQFGFVTSVTVSAQTLKLAAKLAKFYLAESVSLYGECEGELAPQLAKILELAEKRQAPISPRDVIRSNRDFRKLKSDDIRAMFIQLVDLGYGSIVGTGVKIQFTRNLSPLSPVVTSSGDTSKDIQNGCSSHLSPVSPEKKENFELNQPIMDNPTQLDEISKEVESVVTVVTKTENNDTEPLKDCHQVGDCVVTVVTVVTTGDSPEPTPEPLPNDYRPSLAELTSAEPLPPLTNLAVLIDFDSLKEGETIFHANGTPHILRGQGWGYWLTTDGLRIDKENIGNFHRE